MPTAHARSARAPRHRPAIAGRRTITITGHPDDRASRPLPRVVEIDRRRPPRRIRERVAGRPDRIALWAVLMAVFLIFVAASSARAAAPVSPGPTQAQVAAPAALPVP